MGGRMTSGYSATYPDAPIAGYIGVGLLAGGREPLSEAPSRNRTYPEPVSWHSPTQGHLLDLFQGPAEIATELKPSRAEEGPL
jgi:hypothetical protein